MKKKLDEIANAESHESFWEINNIEEEGRLELLFFPFENPKDNIELNTHLTIKVSRKQLDDLFEFCERMNKPQIEVEVEKRHGKTILIKDGTKSENTL